MLERRAIRGHSMLDLLRSLSGALTPDPSPAPPKHSRPGRGAPPPSRRHNNPKQVSPSPGAGVLGWSGRGGRGVRAARIPRLGGLSMKTGSKHHLSGRKIDPKPLTGKESLEEVITHSFTAYNAGRLREACELLVQKMLAPDSTVAMSLSGALTPAGYGKSCLVPLIEAGCIDWMISTGANLYHDTHHAIGLALHAGSPAWNDVELREEGVVRIYDIVFDYSVLLETDKFYRMVMRLPEFQKPMSTP